MGKQTWPPLLFLIKSTLEVLVMVLGFVLKYLDFKLIIYVFTYYYCLKCYTNLLMSNLSSKRVQREIHTQRNSYTRTHAHTKRERERLDFLDNLIHIEENIILNQKENHNFTSDNKFKKTSKKFHLQ